MGNNGKEKWNDLLTVCGCGPDFVPDYNQTGID